jgi:hypothetical protein
LSSGASINRGAIFDPNLIGKIIWTGYFPAPFYFRKSNRPQSIKLATARYTRFEMGYPDANGFPTPQGKGGF